VNELKRRKRQADTTRNTCLLYLQTDFVLYEEYQNTEIIISKLAEHVKAADRIYGNTDFVDSNGNRFLGLNFRVLRIRVSTVYIHLNCMFTHSQETSIFGC